MKLVYNICIKDTFALYSAMNIISKAPMTRDLLEIRACNLYKNRSYRNRENLQCKKTPDWVLLSLFM